MHHEQQHYMRNAYHTEDPENSKGARILTHGSGFATMLFYCVPAAIIRLTFDLRRSLIPSCLHVPFSDHC